jgi:hypothetical protein
MPLLEFADAHYSDCCRRGLMKTILATWGSFSGRKVEAFFFSKERCRLQKTRLVAKSGPLSRLRVLNPMGRIGTRIAPATVMVYVLAEAHSEAEQLRLSIYRLAFLYDL